MSLRNIISKQFKEYTDYRTPDQAMTQMASLGPLSGDLYQDSKRFIYELLQNADDSSIEGSKVKVHVKIFGDTLVVAHNGKAFDERDVRGITGIADGTKRKQKIKPVIKASDLKLCSASPIM
ncbi:ATP-binding protein [Sphingobacterium sp. KU25419]|nr:ATP-binding protein [Sphingobacterium sp. KU25419]